VSASSAKEQDARAAGAPPGLSGGPPAPGPTRRGGVLPLLFGLVLAAIVGFLIWYFLVRDEASEALPPAPAGEVSLDVERIDFGDEDVGGVSVSQRIRLTNGTADAVRVEDVSLDGEAAEDFELLDPDCLNTRLDAGDACAVSVRFRPQETGGRAARLVLSLDGGPGERVVELAGIGTGRATLVADTSRLDFGARPLDGDPQTQQISLVNVGTLPLHILRAAIDGPAAGDYRLGRRARCLGGQELAAGASCVLSVTFAPTEPGQRAAVLRLYHDAAEAPARIQLRGEGAGAALAVAAPASLAFGELDVGEASKARTVTLRNGGTGPLTVAWIAVVGPSASDFELAPGGTCRKGAALEPSASCTIAVAFAPTAGGSRAASLVAATDDPAGFTEIDLTGVGIAPTEEAEARTTPGEVPTLGLPEGQTAPTTP
jgi:hypothetical protein